MAGEFDDVTLTWGGVNYMIPSNRMMLAIARIEDHVSLEDLDVSASQRPKRAKVAMAFASVLRFAGANVTDEQVYAGMFDKATAASSIAALQTLAMMMIPKSALEEATKRIAAGELVPKKGNRRARRAQASSSRKRTK